LLWCDFCRHSGRARCLQGLSVFPGFGSH
jgi:hypothetical protein